MHNISSHHHHPHQVASNSPAAGAGRFIGGGSGGGAGSASGESWQPNYKKDRNFDYGNTADVNTALSEVFYTLFFFYINRLINRIQFFL